MATKTELDETRKKVEREELCLETCKDSEEIYRKIFNLGLVGLAYLGVRSYVSKIKRN